MYTLLKSPEIIEREQAHSHHVFLSKHLQSPFPSRPFGVRAIKLIEIISIIMCCVCADCALQINSAISLVERGLGRAREGRMQYFD